MKKIIVTGNVGRDPETRSDQEGNQFVTFSLAVSVGTKQNPKTDWLDVSCSNKLADFARMYIKRGTKLLVEGFPTANAYINKDNKAVATLRIYANNIEFMGSKRDDEGHHDGLTPTSDPVYANTAHANNYDQQEHSQVGANVDEPPF